MVSRQEHTSGGSGRIANAMRTATLTMYYSLQVLQVQEPSSSRAQIVSGIQRQGISCAFAMLINPGRLYDLTVQLASFHFL